MGFFEMGIGVGLAVGQPAAERTLVHGDHEEHSSRVET
jgi:hypothetical protein